MRQKAEAKKARLEQQRVKLHQRKDLLREIVNEKELKYKARRGQLAENNLQVGCLVMCCVFYVCMRVCR